MPRGQPTDTMWDHYVPDQIGEERAQRPSLNCEVQSQRHSSLQPLGTAHAALHLQSSASHREGRVNTAWRCDSCINNKRLSNSEKILTCAAMWHPVLGHLLRPENEMLRGRLAPLLASVAELGGKINRKK